MTAQGRYATPDSSFGRSAGNAAARGGALVAVAVVIGFLLLWQGGVGGSGDAVTAADSGESDDAIGGDTADAGITSETDAATEDSNGDDAAVPDDTVDTAPEETVAPTPVTRPPGEVKAAVANGVGEAGLAGSRASVLSTAGYVTVAANAAAETAQSQVYYVEGYGEEAQGIAVELGGDAAVLRPAPSDPGALVTDATAVDGFHVFVILGTDRVLG
ncbi:MAG: hypothetical protein CL433_06850 [Acidimicrobiaceae bacterium]|jgi:hypothetical protein|nr:hypothetical protein [Acidimicrobiaceae bacterium]HAB57563.1 hypothetical protein [Acidimicrobiaceae bacterium]